MTFRYVRVEEAIKRGAELAGALTPPRLQDVTRSRRALSAHWGFLKDEPDIGDEVREHAEKLEDLLARETFFKELPLIHAIIAGVILSVAGVIGDLAESMWKRSAAVKDSGTLIPGHGGFLDRFDSIFFTAPILYTYWHVLQFGFTTLNIMQG